jgi:hypothetical protein
MASAIRWSVDNFKESLARLHPKLVTNQCAMKKFILLLLGLNLHRREDGSLDFEYSLNFPKALRSLKEGRGLIPIWPCNNTITRKAKYRYWRGFNEVSFTL